MDQQSTSSGQIPKYGQQQEETSETWFNEIENTGFKMEEEAPVIYGLDFQVY